MYKTISLATTLFLSTLLFGYNPLMLLHSWAAPPLVAYQNDVLGVQVTDTAGLQVIEDGMLAGDSSWGFSLVKHENSGNVFIVLSISLVEQESSDLNQIATKLIAAYPTLPIQQADITVDGNLGKLLLNLPSMDGCTTIYLTVHQQLYRILYFAETLDAAGQKLLHQLHFIKPTRTLASLRLKRAADEPLQATSAAEQALPKGPEIPQSSETAQGAYQLFLPIINNGGSPQSQFMTSSEVTRYKESLSTQAVSGCTDWPTTVFLQTTFASTANKNTGISTAGPSYYNEGEHIRCNSATQENDYYALDFPLVQGDIVYAPFTGVVISTGWSCDGWSSLGRVVIVEKIVGTTKYWSISAHLSSINVAVGTNVNTNTVIGRAGRSGNNIDNLWDTSHLHQAIYKSAKLSTKTGCAAGVYGGTSVQPLHISHFGNGAGPYNSFTRYQKVSW